MNIYDIAREAGVSIATISRVINGKDVVSRKTRQKVEDILTKYNYTPNEIARGLVVNSMKTVGVMTIDIRDIYYANVAYTVERELSRRGYNVMLCNTGGDSGEIINYLKTLLQKKVDGIILVGSAFKDESLESCIKGAAGKVPVVMINGFIESENVYSIISDDAEGISQVVDHIAGKGKKVPVYLKDTDTYSSRSKVEGFKAGLYKNDLIKNALIINENSIINVEKGFNGAFEGIRSLITKKQKFDAVICGDDLSAAGAMKCLKEHGIKIPEQVAVTGFDNSVLAFCCDPVLTSVDNRMNEMGWHAVDIFIKIMDGEKAETRMVIKPELIVRESS